ncbi:MAG: hypothetical protein ACREOI_20945 [bacterium]
MKKINPKSLGQRIVIAASLLPIIFVLYLGGCKSNPAAADGGNDGGNNTPRTAVPAPLAAAWYSGTVSSVNFFNPNTGQWAAPSGTGMFYKFTADGYYEKGVLLQSSLYNCTMTFFAYNKGTMTVEGDKIVLYPTYGRIKSVDNCVASNNYEKPDELASETILWQIGPDEYGFEKLWLRYPNGNPSPFHHR